MRTQRKIGARKGERGQTLILVALSIVSLLAMAALAIDVVSLYAARSEAQRAADAAALAGAQAFVSSGATTDPADLQTAAQTTATGYVNAVLQKNLIAGSVATPSVSFGLNGTNPTITVTVQNSSLPLFFARIWGVRSTSVSATATAEAYNASGSDTPPIALTSVKPWLVANCDPDGTGPCPNYFVDQATGQVLNGRSFIGTTVYLNRIFTGSASGHGGELDFYGLAIPVSPVAPVCPSAGAPACDFISGDDSSDGYYQDNIACASQYQFSCGQTIGPGSNPASPAIGVENLVPASSPTRIGTRCLIHTQDNNDGPILGQDIFSNPPAGTEPTITGGSQNPNSALSGQVIAQSDSVVTVPLYNGSALCGTGGTGSCGSPAASNVIGFLQLGIQQTMTGNGGPEVQAVILNAVGCSPNAVSNFPPTSSTVSGGGTSAIPVRLIQPGS